MILSTISLSLFMCADTVTALALPGNYHEKITHLGRSLFSFSNLTSLDLSRNALETLEVSLAGMERQYMSIIYDLQGLDHLKYLETLNLYYNNIPDLREVFRLRHNTKLKVRQGQSVVNTIVKAYQDMEISTVG